MGSRDHEGGGDAKGGADGGGGSGGSNQDQHQSNQGQQQQPNEAAGAAKQDSAHHPGESVRHGGSEDGEGNARPMGATLGSKVSVTGGPGLATSPDSEGEESEEENEVLEESPCGRYRKMRAEVSYRDVPGIDCAFLAMDTEEGVEVVWNEAVFSETKKFKAQEDKLKNVFEALLLLEHPNIVKFHRYWTDPGATTDDKTGERTKPRVILITEHMSSGSLKKFLKKTKKNNRKIPLQSWKRWCTQILSALSYLHSCNPAIIHGNLTCDTIFIQHNGLVKIGSVAPDAIHKNVKTFRENVKNFHFIAPEWADHIKKLSLRRMSSFSRFLLSREDTISLTPAIDIYAFGMCALETAALELTTNGEGGTQVSQEAVEKSIESLEDQLQKDFIRRCLVADPLKRPKARELLFHPVLFEVHSLKLLAAHTLVKNPASVNESMTEEAIHRYYGNSTIMASLRFSPDEEERLYRLSDFPVHEKLEKFMEDVKYGIYPLTAFALSDPQAGKPRPRTPESQNSRTKSVISKDVELRRILTMQCSIDPVEARKDGNQLSLRILLRMEDKMNRQLSCFINRGVDTAENLARELVQHGFINPQDSTLIVEMLAAAMVKYDQGEEYYLQNNNSEQASPSQPLPTATVSS